SAVLRQLMIPSRVYIIIFLKTLTRAKSCATIICAFCEKEKRIFTHSIIYYAKVAELADALDLGSSG
ncbi:MAG: hypothetical protein A8274_1075, partial [Halanaerobium sp. 4-GBenrich]